MHTQMLQRRGTSAEWAAANPILGDGEIGFDRTTGRLKVGDGVKHWADGTLLPFIPNASPVTSVAGRTGAVVLTAADVAAGTFPGASYTFQGVSVRSGASGSFASYNLGRTADELNLAVSAAGAQWFSDSVAGDISARVPDSSKTLRLGVGTAASQLRIANAGITANVLATLNLGAVLPLGVGLLFNQSSGNQGYILGSGTSVKLRGGTSGFLFNNNADTLSTMTLDDTGGMHIHGATTGVVLHGRDNDSQSYLSYVTGNIWRLYSSTASGDRLTVDSTGKLSPVGDISLPNAKSVQFTMTSGSIGSIGGSGTTLKLRGGSSGLVLRDNADTVDIFKIDNSGAVTLNNAIEIGRQDGVSSTPIIDFHSGATAVDYDTRLLASGGTGVAGQGTLAVYGKFAINVPGVSGATGLTISADGAANLRGPEIAFLDTKAGQTTPNKFMRALGGKLQVLNSGYTTVIWELDDSGNIVSPANASHSVTYLYDPAQTGAYIQTAAADAVYVQTRAAANKGLIIKGFTSQSADLQQWLDSVNVQKAAVDSGGGIFATAGYMGSRVSYGTLTVTPGAIGTIGEVIRGLSGQTADLQQWQIFGGTVGAQVTADGSIKTVTNLSVGQAIPYANNARVNFRNVAGDTGSITLVVQKVFTQTADLIQVLDQNAALLAKFDPLGLLSVPRILITNETTTTGAPVGGAAGALPANPVGYLRMNINGVDRKIPYYS